MTLSTTSVDFTEATFNYGTYESKYMSARKRWLQICIVLFLLSFFFSLSYLEWRLQDHGRLSVVYMAKHYRISICIFTALHLILFFSCVALFSSVSVCCHLCLCLCLFSSLLNAICNVWLCVRVSFFLAQQTLPCVHSKRSRVRRQNARGFCEAVVLPTHTERFGSTHGSAFSVQFLFCSLSLPSISLPTCLRLFSSILVCLCFCCLSSFCQNILSLYSLPFLFLSSDLSSLTTTMGACLVGSFLHRVLICLDDQSAWALAHSLSGEHIRI